MTEYQILCLIGIPSFISALLTYFWKRIKDTSKETEAIKLGLQALLRDRLIQSYKHFSKQGFVGIDDRENFENMYKQYHALGANGVMTDIRNKCMALRTEMEGE